MTTTRPDHWLGARQLWWRTREARKTGDIASLVRVVTSGEHTAVGIRVRGRHVLLLLDPALIGELLVEHAPVSTKGPGTKLTRQLLGDGLLTSEGPPHDRARRLIAPAFSPRRLAGYTECFASTTRSHLDSWNDGQQLDAHAEMASLTMDIVGRTLLGIDLSDRTSTIRESLEAALARFGRIGGGAFLGRESPFATLHAGIDRAINRLLRREPAGSPAPEQSEPDPTEDALHRIVNQVIAERRATPSDDRGDVVSALLSDGEIRDGMSSAEIHDHVLTLLMAGHETSANALTWTLFLLGKHPGVQHRLFVEVRDFADSGPPFADLPNLPYTRAVVAEAMRLYPPAWFLGRTILEPLEFAGWHAPAGTLVGASPMLLHRDPRWFPEPDRFDPSRFLGERRKALPRNAYLPFGTGPRVCIGEQFAWAEVTTALAVLAANWRIYTDPTLDPEIQHRVTLRPAGEVPIMVQRR